MKLYLKRLLTLIILCSGVVPVVAMHEETQGTFGRIYDYLSQTYQNLLGKPVPVKQEELPELAYDMLFRVKEYLADEGRNIPGFGDFKLTTKEIEILGKRYGKENLAKLVKDEEIRWENAKKEFVQEFNPQARAFGDKVRAALYSVGDMYDELQKAREAMLYNHIITATAMEIAQKRRENSPDSVPGLGDLNDIILRRTLPGYNFSPMARDSNVEDYYKNFEDKDAHYIRTNTFPNWGEKLRAEFTVNRAPVRPEEYVDLK